jgi:hypothetical protein
MGSVKKKVNKVFNKAADKLIPKEIAPFLPYASLLLPFMGPMAGIMGSTVGRYAIPQILTALGSAKTTGEIDLKKQALAAASSYLGGPGDESATNMEKAYMKANPNFQDFTKIDPDKLAEFAKTYKPTGNAFLSNAKDFGMGLQRAAGGSEGFLKQASLIGGPILTQGGIDIAEGEIKDQKEKRNRLKQGIADYRSATDELGDYYRNMDADYDRLYGGVDFAKRFLKDGGRVDMNIGGVPSEMLALEQMMPQPKPDRDFLKFMEQMRESSMKERPTGIPEGAGGSSIFDKLRSVTTPARTGLEALSERMMPMLPKLEKPGVEEEELLRKLQREEQEMSRQDAESSLSKLFFDLMGRPEDQYNQGGRVGMNMGGNPGDDISPARMKEFVDFALSDGYDMEEALEYAKRMAAGETQYNQGGRVGLNKGGSAENATNQFQMKLAELLEVGVPLEEAEKQAMDFMQRAFKGLGGYDPIDYNQGGRVGLNQGGMGDIDMMLLELFGNAMDNPKGPPGDQFAPYESNLADMLKAGFRVVKKGGYDPIDYNQGGRVGYNKGGSPSTEVEPYDLEKDFIENGIPAGYKNIEDFYEDHFMNKGGRVGYNQGGSSGMSLVDNKGVLTGFGGKVKDQMGLAGLFELYNLLGPALGMNQGGRVGMNIGGMSMSNMGSIPQTETVPQGMQLDGRGGGFIPMGAQEKKDDVPAMLAKNEFVMTSDAVKAAGGGSIQKGAQRMYDMMNQLEAQV